MKIGLIRETKNPIDNRVALSPKQVAELNSKYPHSKIVVQTSNIRAYSDEEYISEGVEVVSNIEDCDVLFGIKEAKINTLIPNKHYFFFGHIAKMQEYNRPLLQTFLKDNITFSDYEYLIDKDGKRLCAFGWWAGVVGLYYTLQGFGLRERTYTLPKPDLKFTIQDLLNALKSVDLPSVKILITGNGRVSKGAQYILEEIGADRLTEEQFTTDSSVNKLSYFVATTDKLVKRKDGSPYSHEEFKKFPQKYESNFLKWAKYTDIFLSCHFWASDAPVYVTPEILRNQEIPIKVIGDITCDICGSIMSTIRSSTHAEPFYDYNPDTEQEEKAFSSDKNITVMAVDTCPNALAREASQYFGEMLIDHVFKPLLEEKHSQIIENATIVEKGLLTDRFSYLKSFAQIEERN